MGLYRRANSGVWQMRYTDERGREVRRSTRTRDKRAAGLILAEAVRACELRRAGLDVPDPQAARQPIGLVLDAWLRFKAEGGGSAEHHAKQRARVLAAADAMGWRALIDVTPEGVRAHLETLVRGTMRGRFARRRCYETLHALCAWAMEQRPPLLVVNPMDAVPPPPVPRDPRRWALTDEEVERIWHAEEPTHAQQRRTWPERHLAYKLALEAGLRRADVDALTPARVRLGGVRPFLELSSETTKSGRWEQVPLTPRLAADLAAWIEGRDPASAMLRAPRARMVRADLRRLGIETAGQGSGKDFDFHAMRTTFVVRLLRRGVHPTAVQKLARHRDVQTTLRVYAQVGHLEGAEAVLALDGGVPRDVPVFAPSGTHSATLACGRLGGGRVGADLMAGG